MGPDMIILEKLKEIELAQLMVKDVHQMINNPLSNVAYKTRAMLLSKTNSKIVDTEITWLLNFLT